MDIEGIKITKNDINKLNEEGAIYTTKKNRDEGKSVDANTIWFGDNGDMFLDDQGRIIEKQQDGSEIYMGWTDLDKFNKSNESKEKININSAEDYRKYFNKNDSSTTTNNSTNSKTEDKKVINSAYDYNKYFKNGEAPKSSNNSISSIETKTTTQNEQIRINSAYDYNKHFKNGETPVSPNAKKTLQDVIDEGNSVSKPPTNGEAPKEGESFTDYYNRTKGTIPKYNMDEPITNTTQNNPKISGIDINTDPRFQKQANNTSTTNSTVGVNTSNDKRYQDTTPAIDINSDPRFQKQANNTSTVANNTNTRPAIDINSDPRYQKQTKNTNTTNEAAKLNSEIDKIITKNNDNPMPTIDEVINEANKGRPNYTDPNQVTPPNDPFKDIINKPSTANNENLKFANDTLSEINKIRREKGLPDLQWSDNLAKTATIRAEEASQKWSHTRPDGQSWSTALDRDNSKYYGETLSMGNNDPNSIVQAWLESPAHQRELLENNYSNVGISIYQTEDGQIYCAAEFSS